MANYDFTYTGAEIQHILDTAKKLKDSGYIFLGVATPSTNPGTPTQKVYYEAKQAGTYTNFGGAVLPDGISLLLWNGSWTSETVMSGDGGVFDISVYKSSGGTLATYADLSAALDGGNNIPASARKGGMSVKFVQSSDNNYMQFRYMSSSTATADFTNPDNWQGVDSEPTAGSKNLVESGGVANQTNNILYNLEIDAVAYETFDVLLKKGERYHIVSSSKIVDQIRFKDENGTDITNDNYFSTSEPINYYYVPSKDVYKINFVGINTLTIQSVETVTEKAQNNRVNISALSAEIGSPYFSSEILHKRDRINDFPRNIDFNIVIKNVEGSGISYTLGKINTDASYTQLYSGTIGALEEKILAISSTNATSLVFYTLGGGVKYKYLLSENINDELAKLTKDTKEVKTGSGYQTFVHQLLKYHTYKVTLVEASREVNMNVYGLVDAETPQTSNVFFNIKNGETKIIIPTENYEALYYGINGSCTIEISDMDSRDSESWNHVFYCGATRKYTKLIDAIAAAELYMNSVLYVDDGYYDLIEEFGSDYFASINANSYLPGISLCHGIKIIFSANSRVICHYNGDNQYVKTLFSPFNAGKGGFEIQNLNLACSNVRYAVHDERNGSPIQSWSIYKNCYMEINNTNNDAWQSTCCIGGGLGSNTAVTVENCCFKAVREGADAKTGVYYHNISSSLITNASSYVVIKDNNCEDCRIVISDGRTDLTKKTTYNICGNKANSIVVEFPNNTNAVVNMWNNDLQNS